MLNQQHPHLILRPKKSSAIGLLVICVLFVCCGIWIAPIKGWLGYLVAGFFAIGIPIAIVQLLPGSTMLELNAEGMIITNLYRAITIPWQIIDGFFVVSLNQYGTTVQKLVGFNFVPSYDRARTGRRISTALAECEGSLPHTYGQSAEELAALLNRCLEEFNNNRSQYGDEQSATPRNVELS